MKTNNCNCVIYLIIIMASLKLDNVIYTLITLCSCTFCATIVSALIHIFKARINHKCGILGTLENV
ncbi:unnamed protein product [Tenebrio molitor]|nr:unnamed protein product [Tenebrio molitor]